MLTKPAARREYYLFMGIELNLPLGFQGGIVVRGTRYFIFCFIFWCFSVSLTFAY
jgi:hypothetical protein